MTPATDASRPVTVSHRSRPPGAVLSRHALPRRGPSTSERARVRRDDTRASSLHDIVAGASRPGHTPSRPACWLEPATSPPLAVRRVARPGASAVCTPFAGAPETWAATVLAAVLARGPGAVASHRHRAGAARHRPARRDQRMPVEVSVPSGRGIRQCPASSCIASTAARADVTAVDGIPCTTYERTLVDSAAQARASAALARAWTRASSPAGNVSIGRRRTSIDSAPAPGRRRSRASLASTSARPESDLTRRARRRSDSSTAIRARGLPAPMPQHRVTIDGEDFRLDAALPRAPHRARVPGLGSAPDALGVRRRPPPVTGCSASPAGPSSTSPRTSPTGRSSTTVTRLMARSRQA